MSELVLSAIISGKEIANKIPAVFSQRTGISEESIDKVEVLFDTEYSNIDEVKSCIWLKDGTQTPISEELLLISIELVSPIISKSYTAIAWTLYGFQYKAGDECRIEDEKTELSVAFLKDKEFFHPDETAQVILSLAKRYDPVLFFYTPSIPPNRNKVLPLVQEMFSKKRFDIFYDLCFNRLPDNDEFEVDWKTRLAIFVIEEVEKNPACFKETMNFLEQLNRSKKKSLPEGWQKVLDGLLKKDNG